MNEYIYVVFDQGDWHGYRGCVLGAYTTESKAIESIAGLCDEESSVIVKIKINTKETECINLI